VFSKVGRVASEEVTLQLLKSKSLSVLYGLTACPSQICSHSILSLTGSSWNSPQLKVLKLWSIAQSTLTSLYRVYYGPSV